MYCLPHSQIADPFFWYCIYLLYNIWSFAQLSVYGVCVGVGGGGWGGELFQRCGINIRYFHCWMYLVEGSCFPTCILGNILDDFANWSMVPRNFWKNMYTLRVGTCNTIRHHPWHRVLAKLIILTEFRVPDVLETSWWADILLYWFNLS
jgi:hypothetical protein